jgi:hypothetical protein
MRSEQGEIVAARCAPATRHLASYLFVPNTMMPVARQRRPGLEIFTMVHEQSGQHGYHGFTLGRGEDCGPTVLAARPAFMAGGVGESELGQDDAARRIRRQ